MQLPPLDVLLTWPVGNYTHPSEVRGPAVLILTLFFVPTLLILVALRAYTRLRLTKNFGPDDIAIVASVVPTLGCAVITMLAVLYHGWDRHVWDVPPDQLVLALKLSMAVEILYSFACSLTRLSILLLVLRVMAAGAGALRTITIFMIALVGIEEFIFCVVALNTCRPVSDYWTLSIAPQNCINEAAHILAAGIINTVTDFIVVLIPIPVVLKLRLPLRQRILCAVLFGAGFIVCIAGGVRIKYTYELNTQYDKTWLFYPTWICGTIELYLGIIATTVPAIKPLIFRYFPNILGLSSDPTTRGGGPLSTIHLTQTRNQQQHPQHSRRHSAITNTSPTPSLADSDLELAKHPAISHRHSMPADPSSFQEDIERASEGQRSGSRGLRFEKGRVILQPVISAFSTYRTGSNWGGAVAGAAGEWKSAHPLASSASLGFGGEKS